MNMKQIDQLSELRKAGGTVLTQGLSDAQITHLATAKGVRKVSRRDLPIVVARKLDGATTVATTMWIAQRFGIEVFATGGIGGVHRGAELHPLCRLRSRGPAPDTAPPVGPAHGGVGGHQRRHLGEGEDEDEVEEQLERGHPTLGHHRLLAHGRDARRRTPRRTSESAVGEEER